MAPLPGSPLRTLPPFGRGSALALVALLWLAAAPPAALASDDGPALAARILAESQGDYDRAAAALDDAIGAASGEAEQVLRLFLGDIHRLLGETRPATKQFKAVARSGGPLARAGDLGLVLVAGLDKLDDAGVSLLRTVAEDGLPDSMNAERHTLLTAVAAARDQAGPAAEHTRAALRFAASDPNVERDVRARLRKLTEGDLPASTPAPADEIAALDRAVTDGDRDRVRALAARILESAEPGSDREAIARYAERRLDAVAQPRLIGVLLPLSGRFAGVGRQVRRALELGAASSGATTKLIFVDSGEDPAKAIAALEKLVLTDGVVAVVGPVVTAQADAVARAAEALRVPMIGLFSQTTASHDRPWVFEGVATAAAQAQALVSFVMDHRAMKRFAIFAPESAYGHDAADAFAAAVLARGGQITVREHYDPDSNDLIPFAKKLGRKDYTARAAEFREVRRSIADMGGDPSRAVLPPVLDFDAIFVPDGHRRIPVAASGLAYEEFPVGQFRIKKDGPTIPLLGLSGWNHPDIVTSGGPYVRDSLFVDVWLPDSAEGRAFSAAYRAEAGRDPSGLEAQAYAVGRILGALGRDVASPADARRRLAALQVDRTGTGATGIEAERGRVDHALRILTLDREGIREIAPPAKIESGHQPGAGASE